VVIGLFALLPILGMLAAIAIPAYSDYTQRAVTASAINEAGAAKVAIAEFVATNQRLPESLSEAGVAEQLSTGTLSLQDGVLVITIAAPGTTVDGSTIGLEPYQDDSGGVAWRCGNASPPDGATDITGGDASYYTSLASTALPQSCR
jgi:type IV pilus assembly protein PilA